MNEQMRELIKKYESYQNLNNPDKEVLKTYFRKLAELEIDTIRGNAQIDKYNQSVDSYNHIEGDRYVYGGIVNTIGSKFQKMVADKRERDVKIRLSALEGKKQEVETLKQNVLTELKELKSMASLAKKMIGLDPSSYIGYIYLAEVFKLQYDLYKSSIKSAKESLPLFGYKEYEGQTFLDKHLAQLLSDVRDMKNALNKAEKLLSSPSITSQDKKRIKGKIETLSSNMIDYIYDSNDEELKAQLRAEKRAKELELKRQIKMDKKAQKQSKKLTKKEKTQLKKEYDSFTN